MAHPEIEDVYVLSPVQEGMLFHTLYDPGAGTYLDQVVLELAGPVSPEALERAWRRVVDRHPALRTTFQWDGLDKPVQVVLRPGKAAPVELVRLDWSGHRAGEPTAEERLEAWLAEDRRRGFDLERGPLLRLALARMPDGSHRLLWSYHHIVLDAWSGSILFRELFALYAADLRGVDPPLPPAVPYRRYIAWLRRQDGDAARAFWRRHLGELTEPARLPIGEAPPSGEPEMGEVELTLGSAALSAFARSHRLTLATVVSGAWALVLADATTNDDVVFGTTVSGRPAEVEQVESIVGLLINTLPLRVGVRPEAQLVEWLRGLQSVQNEMRRYEYSSLADVQEASGIGHELFQTLLAFENVPGAEMANEDAEAPSATGVVGSRYVFRTHYPLTVQVLPGRRLVLRLVHDRRRLGTAAVTRLRDRLAMVLEAIPEHADGRLADLPRLAPGERHLLEVAWRGTSGPYPRTSSIPDLVGRWCEQVPDAIALVQGDAHLTYRALDRASTRLAGRLAALGVGPETRVGVALPRSPELVVTLLAVLRAGGAYVALDEGYPRERLDFLARDSDLKVLVTRSDRFGGLAEKGVHVLAPTLDPAGTDRTDRAEGAEEAAPTPACPADPSSLSYVAYTSGSTGRPKGVAVTHRGVVRLVCGTGYARFAPDETFVQTAPVAFDASTYEIWGALCHGGRLVLAPPGLLSLDRIEEETRRHRITTFWVTTGLFREIVEEAPGILGGPRQVVTGGEAGSPEHFERALQAMHPGAHLVHAYGPTENTTFSTTDRYVAGRSTVGPSTPIGRPIAHSTAHVVDADLETVPLGAPGELLLGGDGLARGYLHRPRETAERFVPDPFGTEPGERLYRSGDRVRMLDDGRLEFLGRIDQQVKVRGFRIEPQEVEEALLRHPLVRSAVVAARDDAPGGRALVAYVVPVPEAAREELGASILDELREHLPSFSVPSHLVPIDRVPLKPQGKVDRAALPVPDGTGSRAGGAHRPPGSPTEVEVARLWSELLEVEDPGLDDDFFAAGGHSLLATRLASRVRKRFQVDLPLETLFRDPTLGAVAAWVEDRTGEAAPDDVADDELVAREPGPDGEREGAAPLSFAQERLWFLDRLQPGSAAYNVPLALSLEGHLDAAVLDRAWSATVRRHETLRTRFVERDGEGFQEILPARPLRLPRIDLGGLPDDRRRQVAHRIAAREAQQPFDLAAGEPARGRLLRLGPERHVLLLTLHHAVSDGWSLGVLLEELTSAYRTFVEGRPDDRSEPPIQYADYAVWQRRRLQGELLEREVTYWRDRLASAPATLDLPFDHPRPAVQRFRGGVVHLRLGPEASAALESLATSHRSTLFTVLLAAYATFLARHGRQRDLTVGVPVAGRTRTETEELIGFFVNTLVLRLDLGNDPSFSRLLDQAREVVLGAHAHQELPFEKLTAELQPHRDLSRNPLFQTLFSFQNTPEPAWSLPGLELRPVQVDVPVSKLDLEVALAVDGDGLAGSLTYDSELFERSTAHRMARHLAALLESIGAQPASRLSELPMLSAAEHQQLLREWNDTARPATGTCWLHLRVADQARRVPDRVAVVTDREYLTYGALQRASRALADRLAGHGVGPDRPVGIAMGRSPRMVIALLAVLEAGGAYVPLDPSYPSARLAFMLEDSGAGVVLTEPGLGTALPEGGYRVLELGRRPGDEVVPAVAKGTVRPRAQLRTELLTEPPVGPAAGPDALAYVIYTSGSTGRPKGVAISHAAATAFLSWAHRAFPSTVWDGVLASTSLSFDLSVFELFGPLSTGGTLLLCDSALDLLTSSTARRARVINTVPSAMRELLAAGGLPPGVSHVNLAGEPLQRSLVEAIHRDAPHVEVRNLYGPSEDTTYSTWDRTPPAAADSPSIGRPVDGTRAFALGDGLRPVPAGAAGELHLAGGGLARGYLRRAALTAERFVPDPWGAGGRLYRTGDLVRHRSDGRLEFLGRIDHQIKSRGFRIEPREIESVLADHPAVREAVVVPWDDSGGHSVPVAYVVYDHDLSELREYLGKQLPAYMVPTAIVPLDTLPLTPSGKVDRRSLPAPGATEAERESVPPRTETERRVAAVWAGVLGRDEVGVRDNFFHLGGHSLLLVRIHARLRRELGVTLSVMELFQYPTVETLARRLDSQSGDRGGGSSSYEHASDRAARKRAALGRRRGGRR